VSEKNQSVRRAPKVALIFAGSAVAALAVGAAGYWLGAHRASQTAAKAESGRRVLYWYDPMVPDRHFDRPGKSPFMDMQLVPRYADEATAQAGVRIDPSVVQNLGVRLATVESAPFAQSVRAAGVIAFSERNVAVVQARANGFVERGYSRAVGDVVEAGAPLVDIRVPEWTAAQAEYLALRGAGHEIEQAARRRLAMLGMPKSLIERVAREGVPRPVVTVTAPIAGALTALEIRNGMTVIPGAPLATIKSTSPVWLVMSLPQADAGVARVRARVSANIPAYPGKTFSGSIESVLPAADPATRTVEVRVALPNPNGRLRPGMTAEAQLIETDARPSLLVPAEAVIQTGRRTVAIVALANGRFAPTEIVLGRRSGNRIEVRRGLIAGQRVVASGQFLIDSEASLSGALERLQGSASGPPAPSPTKESSAARTSSAEGPSDQHSATGRITALSGAQITIAHGPIASLRWPAMTMQFELAHLEQARGLRAGEQVSFRFRRQGARYVIDDIRKAGR
jgi:Cu(I)/Ag(I) efflux system membrane fusion protein